MKKGITAIMLSALMLGSLGTSVKADESIDEMWGNPIFVYGGSLSTEQKLETEKILEIDGVNNVDEVAVTGEDLVKYLGGNGNANMYSSAYIEKVAEGSGVIVEVLKPDNITEVDKSQYANALITAGAEDVYVKVASPVKVSGHSALTGIYKAYEEKGVDLDVDRMVVAQEELTLSTGITKELEDDETFDAEYLTQALIHIKQELAEIKDKLGEQVTKEDIEGIVNKELKEQGLEEVLTEEHIARLVSYSEKYIEIDGINSDSVKEQLGNLTTQVAGNIKEKAGELGSKVKDTVTSEGFIDKVREFFSNIFKAIKGLFS